MAIVNRTSSFTGASLYYVTNNSICTSPPYRTLKKASTLAQASDIITSPDFRQRKISVGVFSSALNVTARLIAGLVIPLFAAPLGVGYHYFMTVCKTVVVGTQIFTHGWNSKRCTQTKVDLSLHFRAGFIDIVSILTTPWIALHFAISPQSATEQFLTNSEARSFRWEQHLLHNYGIITVQSRTCPNTFSQLLKSSRLKRKLNTLHNTKVQCNGSEVNLLPKKLTETDDHDLRSLEDTISALKSLCSALSTPNLDFRHSTENALHLRQRFHDLIDHQVPYGNYYLFLNGLHAQLTNNLNGHDIDVDQLGKLIRQIEIDSRQRKRFEDELRKVEKAASSRIYSLIYSAPTLSLAAFLLA